MAQILEFPMFPTKKPINTNGLTASYSPILILTSGEDFHWAREEGDPILLSDELNGVE
jgi:hypothetical protein